MTGKIVGSHTRGTLRYFLDGREVDEAEFQAAFPDQPLRAGDLLGAQGTTTWPLLSDAVGVHPHQRAEAEASARSKGVPTEFNSKGQAVFTSREHRKRYCRLYGFIDRNGGYSDP